MKYLVDSDWVADYLGDRADAVALLSKLTPDGIAMSLLTFGEIYEGIYYGRDPERAETIFLELLKGVEVLPLTRPIMQNFARIRGELRKRGQLISDPDLLIAATARVHDVTLITRNVRHFERIPGLKLYQQA
ncbi:MAG: type II toxin-antitoxin system VapC family toxin [Chloroflexota bacterium]